MYCSSCGLQLSASARFCPRCGQAVDAALAETVMGNEEAVESNIETLAPDAPPEKATVPRVASRLSSRLTPPIVAPALTHVEAGPRATPGPPRPGIAGNPAVSHSDPIGGGRFTPGTIIAERYRIVALLGRGGMGEVYRAEDLRLSQVLAIKFLPESLTQDATALGRFHSEVRTARQVSHPNVCRMFDIGDADGVPFLTMEYVDGEDLSSLVRRIGRLPQDKAIEVTRQICAGLAAAHERGVVHRDLKPANVMLDGAGKVRITDFGLAGIAENIKGAELRAGTPAYMAPEQMAGKEVTIKSDIYSLGLVMYEVLTGKRAFDAATMPELLKSREAGTITNPSSLVRDLDPLLERVVLRCIEKDPAKRPASALQVSAALPGGDPLAAALAAGETPSPEMVAAAGETGGLNPRIGLLCIAGVCVLLGLLLWISPKTKLVSYISFGPGPEVLSHKAQEMIRSFGYPSGAADSARGFDLAPDYLQDIREHQKTTTRWQVLRQDEPPAMLFWYRENPRALTPMFPADNLVFGRVTPDDPPLRASDARLIVLSPNGKLVDFQAVPPQVDEPLMNGALPATNWNVLFAAAGLDISQFKPIAPTWYPLAWGDARAAWEGQWPNRPEIPLKIEAASYRGKAIYFALLSPWDKPARMEGRTQSKQNRIGQWFGFFLICLVLGVGVYIAAKNMRAGRGDLQGSRRLAIFVMIIGMINWALLAHHVSSSFETLLFILAVSASLFYGLMVWILYVSLEPYVRRHWPDTLISWSRLMAGKFGDPVVARDVLLGTIFGLVSAFLEQLQQFVEIGFGKAPIRPFGLTSTYALENLRGSFASVLGQISSSLLAALVIFFLFFVIRLVIRRNWLAAVLMALVFTIPSLGAQNPLIDALFTAPFFLIYLYILYRFGLVALTALYFVDQLADNLPIAMPLTAWQHEGGVVAILVILGVALYGLQVSRAGKPFFSGNALES
jgi:Protein kinase domain/zinc-ribbon domain